MLIINKWFGKNGNNILQIIRAIHFSILNNHKIIKFNKHILFNNTEIVIFNKNLNTNIIKDEFFYIKKYNIIDPEPYIMREYFQKYIFPIFKIKHKNNLINSNEIYIHLRGGDNFSNIPFNVYVQPPLSYYKNIIKKYKNIKIISEDNKNPCINELLKLNNVENISNTLINDLTNLCNCENLIIGFGTFGLIPYFSSVNLKNLYIPKYFVNELPNGNWGNINVHIIDLPNYIKVGEWKNTSEQRKIMLDYKY